MTRIVRLKSMAEFRRHLAKDLKDVEKKTSRALAKTAQKGAPIVRAEAPRDTGDLRNSIHAITALDTSYIRIAAPTAGYVIKGTRPHMPPVEPILEWVLRQGLAADDKSARQIAWAIAKHIEEHGTEPNDFVERAMPRINAIMRAELIAALGNDQ